MTDDIYDEPTGAYPAVWAFQEPGGKAMAKAKTQEPALLELGVDFSTVSIGKKTASIGVSFAREAIELPKADEHFCERRLSCCIIGKPRGWDADEQALPGMEEDVELHGVADVSGVRFTSKQYTIKLSFNLNAIDVATIADFAKRAGRLVVNEVAELPEVGEDGDDE